jgi:hypothetical protein
MITQMPSPAPHRAVGGGWGQEWGAETLEGGGAEEKTGRRKEGETRGLVTVGHSQCDLSLRGLQTESAWWGQLEW